MKAVSIANYIKDDIYLFKWAMLILITLDEATIYQAHPIF